MTRDEWTAVSLVIENCWQGEFDDDRADAYFSMLEHFTVDQVLAALRLLAEGGRPFIPTVPEITLAARTVAEPLVPSWSEAWSMIQLSIRRCRTEEQAVEFLGKRAHRFVGAFVAAEGFDKLRYEPVEDPEFGSLRLRDLQGRWKEFCERSIERERHGLAITPGPRSERDGLGRVDLAGLIGVGE